MAEMLDCLVSYFSEDANAEGLPRRYLAYHVVAGPGPTPEGGVASITPKSKNGNSGRSRENSLASSAVVQTTDRYLDV